LFLPLMLGFRSAWADWVTVPTGSMNPTILEGDRLLVDKHVFGLRISGPLTVPNGMYFMLGDNRDNSADSRYFGFVPRRNIVGRAIRVVVSLDPADRYTPRRDRLLVPLN
jgi:hypothetical protein